MVQSDSMQLDDPLHIVGGLIAWIKAKRMKGVLNGLTEDVWIKEATKGSELGLERSTSLIPLIQAFNGPDLWSIWPD